MKVVRSWKYRIYPTKEQEIAFQAYLEECRKLWNYLLSYTREYYKRTNKLPTRNQLYILSKKTKLFSQVSQNVADKLVKSFRRTIAIKKKGGKIAFPRFKTAERMKSFTYPQFGFTLTEHLLLSKIGEIRIKKHRKLKGKIKTLTIKKMPSGKWFAIFNSEVEMTQSPNEGQKVGIDLGIEHFVALSNNKIIDNPRHLKKAEHR